jgi:hypothetical protein
VISHSYVSVALAPIPSAESHKLALAIFRLAQGLGPMLRVQALRPIYQTTLPTASGALNTLVFLECVPGDLSLFEGLDQPDTDARITRGKRILHPSSSPVNQDKWMNCGFLLFPCLARHIVQG